jgi:hypothetical protein
MKAKAYFSFAILFSAIFLCVSTKHIDASPYVKGRDAQIENKGKEGLSSFGAVIHALHGVDHFRKHYKDGKKNSAKKKLKSLFSQLKSKKRVKTAKAQRFAQFFEKKAKKMNIRNNIFLSTHFLLTRCGMPALEQTKKITFYPLHMPNEQDSKPLTYFLTNKQLRVFHLPVRKRSRAKTLSQLMKEKRILESVQASNLKRDLQNSISLILPKEIHKDIENHPASYFRCKVEYQLRIKDEHSAPKILPIYLHRIHKDSYSDLEIVKKKIRPSKTLDIPLENTPSKVARYALVSMIGEKAKYYEGHLLYHPYTHVLTKKKKQNPWTYYDHQRVKSYTHPKRSSNVKVSPFMRLRGPYKEILRNGSLFFYRFVGYKEV